MLYTYILDILCKLSEHIIASNKRWKLRSSTTPLSFDAPSPRSPSEYPHIAYNFYKLETSIYILPLIVSAIQIFMVGSKYYFIFARMTFRPFKVVDFGANRKRACDFLLVRPSNLGPILHRFGDIAGFLCSWVTPPYSTPILGVFSLHQIAHVGVTMFTMLQALSYFAVKLFSKNSNLCDHDA